MLCKKKKKPSLLVNLSTMTCNGRRRWTDVSQYNDKIWLAKLRAGARDFYLKR